MQPLECQNQRKSIYHTKNSRSFPGWQISSIFQVFHVSGNPVKQGQMHKVDVVLEEKYFGCMGNARS